MPFGAPISADTLSDARRGRLGALPRRGGLRREPQRRRRPPRPADRDDRHLVRRGRQVRRDARRRQRPGPLLGERAVVGRAPRPYVYYPDTQSVPYFAAPKVLNRPHSITAEVEIPDGGAEGVLLCQGAAAGGYTLFIQDGRLHYVHNYVAREYFRVVSKDPVPAGSHDLRFEFEPTGELDLANGKGAPGRLPALRRRRARRRDRRAVHDPRVVQPRRPHLRSEPRIADHPRLRGLFAFSGTIHQVTVDVSGELIEDSETEMKSDGPPVRRSPKLTADAPDQMAHTTTHLPRQAHRTTPPRPRRTAPNRRSVLDPPLYLGWACSTGRVNGLRWLSVGPSSPWPDGEPRPCGTLDPTSWCRR